MPSPDVKRGRIPVSQIDSVHFEERDGTRSVRISTADGSMSLKLKGDLVEIVTSGDAGVHESMPVSIASLTRALGMLKVKTPRRR